MTENKDFSAEVTNPLSEYDAELDLLLTNPCVEEIRPGDITHRALHGYAMSDIWNLGSHLNWIIASHCRYLKTPPALKLLEAVIELNDICNQSTYPLDGEGNLDVLQRMWHDRANQKYDQIQQNWFMLYNDAFPVSEVHCLADSEVREALTFLEEAIAGIRKLSEEGKDTSRVILWEDVKAIIHDPTVVEVEDVKTHREERGLQGFSRFDHQNPRAHVAWLLTQCSLFLVSEKAAGFSARFENFTQWQLEVLGFIRGLWIDAFLPEDENITDGIKAVKSMPTMLPDLWD